MKKVFVFLGFFNNTAHVLRTFENRPTNDQMIEIACRLAFAGEKYTSFDLQESDLDIA